ncbi:hypothetical protein M441DRAFT_44580 [Trichoderma asperellum CBS 433.97]|uniref:Uncharacterized protein n=1 Tax=Trichoderma asperellum (strain ATCC 204424 / CBS 433.97 / NBRC 101777) TaxID=1042311 RepID=A0A2T3ZIA3_TRIA4|nr:hypothetical protein M441DRAFT_44580 [Trichoderma asperellum CBS 433.97]PTB44526.1 hypothetical protein M441DRAFT_44580 [Trichoderma asperellum CBS 433.97]
MAEICIVKKQHGINFFIYMNQYLILRFPSPGYETDDRPIGHTTRPSIQETFIEMSRFLVVTHKLNLLYQPSHLNTLTPSILRRASTFKGLSLRLLSPHEIYLALNKILGMEKPGGWEKSRKKYRIALGV